MTLIVYCRLHSQPDAGVFVLACGIWNSLGGNCPCVTGDRYVVVDEARSGAGWRQAADVVICRPRWTCADALRATDTAMADLPGCTMTVARTGGGGGVLRTRETTALLLLSNEALHPARLAARAHHWHVQHGIMWAGTPAADVPPR